MSTRQTFMCISGVGLGTRVVSNQSSAIWPCYGGVGWPGVTLGIEEGQGRSNKGQPGKM